MKDLAQLDVGSDADILDATLSGEVDLSNAVEIEIALERAIPNTARGMVLDLSGLEYLDSAGINALFNHADEVDRLYLIVHPFLIRVLTISGLSEIAVVEAAAPPKVGG